MRRLLITSCSATKRPGAEPMPAIERYDGPSFKTIRKSLRDLPIAQRPHILILSAKYGLIRDDVPIEDYDLRMRAQLAGQIANGIRAELRRKLHRRGPYTETLINLGADYAPALTLALQDSAVLADLGSIVHTSGGIGVRLGQLKRWMYRSL